MCVGGWGDWCVLQLSAVRILTSSRTSYVIKLELASVCALSVMQSLCRVTEMKLASAMLVHMTAYLKLFFVICVEKNLSFLLVYQPHT